MAHIVPNPQTIDYHTVLPDSYITILINGNIFQFSDNYAANGDAGGKKAAKELVSSMAAVIQQVGHGRGVYPLIIRILGNPEWLSDVLFEASVIPDRANFGWFLQGFNGVKPLVEFTAVADGPSMPVYRTRDMTEHLKTTLFDPHCRFIIYGDVITDKTMQILTENHQATAKERLMLLEYAPEAPNYLGILPDLSHVLLPGVFLETPRRTTVPRLNSVIFRNAAGQRVDPPTTPIDSIAIWLRTQHFCNDHFLRGECPDHRCRARHDGTFNAEQLVALRFLARGLPCRYSNLCRDPDCLAGHMCPWPACRRDRCRFYGDMHVEDRQIAWYE